MTRVGTVLGHRDDELAPFAALRHTAPPSRSVPNEYPVPGWAFTPPWRPALPHACGGTLARTPGVVLDGLVVSEAEHGANSHARAHAHRGIVLRYVLAGRLVDHIGSTDWAQDEGVLLMIPPGIAHAPHAPAAARCLTVEVSPAWCATLPGGAAPEGLETSLFRTRRLSALLREIEYELRHTRRPSAAALDALVRLLVVTLSRVPPLRRPWSVPPWLLQARDALSRQGARMRLRDLAGELGVHPVHLSRAFAAHYGITMSEYRRVQRVARATHLLANGHESITRIAYACGFVDQAHLTRAFKQATGVTPATYRARARQAADQLHDRQP